MIKLHLLRNRMSLKTIDMTINRYESILEKNTMIMYNRTGLTTSINLKTSEK